MIKMETTSRFLSSLALKVIMLNSKDVEFTLRIWYVVSIKSSQTSLVLLKLDYLKK